MKTIIILFGILSFIILNTTKILLFGMIGFRGFDVVPNYKKGYEVKVSWR